MGRSLGHKRAPRLNCAFFLIDVVIQESEQIHGISVDARQYCVLKKEENP